MQGCSAGNVPTIGIAKALQLCVTALPLVAECDPDTRPGPRAGSKAATAPTSSAAATPPQVPRTMTACPCFRALQRLGSAHYDRAMAEHSLSKRLGPVVK